MFGGHIYSCSLVFLALAFRLDQLLCLICVAESQTNIMFTDGPFTNLESKMNVSVLSSYGE